MQCSGCMKKRIKTREACMNKLYAAVCRGKAADSTIQFRRTHTRSSSNKRTCIFSRRSTTHGQSPCSAAWPSSPAPTLPPAASLIPVPMSPPAASCLGHALRQQPETTWRRQRKGEWRCCCCCYCWRGCCFDDGSGSKASGVGFDLERAAWWWWTVGGEAEEAREETTRP